MIKKIPVSKIRVGVHVEKIDQTWFSTPFLSNQFKITSENQVQKFKDYGIQEVYINTQKGLDVAGPDLGVIEKKKEEKKVEVVEYFGFSPGRLLSNTVLPFDLYLKKDNKHKLYLRKGHLFHSEVQNYLEPNSIDTVYIPLDQKGLLGNYERSIQRDKDLSEKGLVPGFESPEKVEQYNNYLNNYMPIDPEIFSPGMKVPFSIYAEKETQVTIFLEADRIVPEDEVFCQKSNGKSGKNILIHLNDCEKYKNFIRGLASHRHSGDSEEALRIRTAIIKENSKLVTKELLENPRSGETVKEVKNVASEMIENILENPSSFYGLMRINTYDYYTYLHSINVCTLSIGLGISLGLKNSDLSSLAIGTLMHDVGKSQVPNNFINKPGKLTDQEFVQVKKHVNLGLELMEEHDELPKRTFIPLLQHHEKLNGTGYPNKLEDNKIHLFGRITSIVDVYDALTTERAYKKAFKPFEAARLLAKNKEEYDQEVFSRFVRMLGEQAA